MTRPAIFLAGCALCVMACGCDEPAPVGVLCSRSLHFPRGGYVGWSFVFLVTLWCNKGDSERRW